MSQTIELPRVGGPGSGLDDNWRVIVLNDNHNTFEGVASALAAVLPGVSFDLRHGHGQPHPQHRPGDRVVRPARNGRALLGAAQRPRAHDGSA
jgi:ATP-dependent Clp protease adaptor protein ClpS